MGLLGRGGAWLSFASGERPVGTLGPCRARTVVANNLMTIGALQAIAQTPLAIPDDIAVVGFDDVPWATALHPPLTVVAQPTYQIGVTAA